MKSLVPNARPELLAPVGSPEALIAAVRCGADAVYLGAGRFHARQHSTPFSEEELARTVAYCHERGVAVHLTLNTLVRENEFSDALREAELAAKLGVDALIVQDRGLAAALHRAAPELTLHASTQLTCHTPAGVRFLKDRGFSRVVLAREMTEAEIAACCKEDCEIEVFVHGALCMSVSGQCLLSAFLGGRSGNRGHCAQPCRLPFCLHSAPKETDRALSLKDLSLISHLPSLTALGVDSLKIEGRMKRPEYVAAAVTACRAALDGTPPDEALLEDLRAVFSRSGFTDGYFTDRRTIAMFGSRTKDDVTAAPAAQKRLASLYRRERVSVPLTMSLTMHRLQPLSLTLSDRDGHRVTVCGDIPRDSANPLPNERIRSALLKLGDTPFAADTVTLDRDAEADAPLSAVNALRREACAVLLARRGEAKAIPFAAAPANAYAPYTPAKPALVVRLPSEDRVSEALLSDADALVLPLDTAPAVWQSLSARLPLGAEIPRGLFGREDAIKRSLAAAKANGASFAVAHNVGAVPLCREVGLPAVGGFGLHTFNAATAHVHFDDGLVGCTLSPELSFAQMRFAAAAPLPMGAVLYGRVPLMLLRNCPASAARGCRDCKQDRALIDRKGAVFPLQCAGGCADLLNSVPLYTADALDDLPPLAFWWLHATTESKEELSRLTAAYRAAADGNEAPKASALLPKGFTRGRTAKGVE
ncbi:MAG: U32 family peptidase [Clostridia bacterium]|nr:U32 family peptidase [Clostridia bacterium]